jgi:tRNA1(Val) A37 N6-methylase TrmN6
MKTNRLFVYHYYYYLRLDLRPDFDMWPPCFLREGFGILSSNPPYFTDRVSRESRAEAARISIDRFQTDSVLIREGCFTTLLSLQRLHYFISLQNVSSV